MSHIIQGGRAALLCSVTSAVLNVSIQDFPGHRCRVLRILPSLEHFGSSSDAGQEECNYRIWLLR